MNYPGWVVVETTTHPRNPRRNSLQCRRFLWARNLLAKVPCWNYRKSKMAATTILRTRTRFRPPKIRLHSALQATEESNLVPRVLSYPPYGVLPTERGRAGRREPWKPGCPRSFPVHPAAKFAIFRLFANEKSQKSISQGLRFFENRPIPIYLVARLGGIKQKAQQRIIHFFCFIPPSLGAKHEF